MDRERGRRGRGGKEQGQCQQRGGEVAPAAGHQSPQRQDRGGGGEGEGAGSEREVRQHRQGGAAPPARRERRRDHEPPEGGDGEQHDEVELRLEPRQDVLPAVRQHEGGEGRGQQPGQRTPPGRPPGEHQPQAQRRHVEEGVDRHLQQRAPAAVGRQQGQGQQARGEDAVFVVGGQQVGRRQGAAQPGVEQEGRLGVPLVPERRGAREVAHDPQAGGEEQQEQAGDGQHGGGVLLPQARGRGRHRGGGHGGHGAASRQ